MARAPSCSSCSPFPPAVQGLASGLARRQGRRMPDFSLFMNPRRGPPGVVTLPAAGFRRAKAEITSWDSYAPTPLLDLPLPGTIRVKDESGRFGLGSFKALGGAYAVVNLLADTLSRLDIIQS